MRLYNLNNPEDREVLETECSPVKETQFLDSEFHNICRKLVRCMDEWNGAGLAANQVGIPMRFFSIALKDETIVMCNPEIITATGKIKQKESCLSVDDYKPKVKRKAFLEVKFRTPKGVHRDMFLTSMEAVCFQHELDHLNGIHLRNNRSIK